MVQLYWEVLEPAEGRLPELIRQEMDQSNNYDEAEVQMQEIPSKYI